VGELPLSTQVRLLRVLETGEFIRVGSSKAQKTNVRVTAATNVDMLQAVQRGKFREDLFYRLNTVPIHIPALRERKEDIHLLFRWFAQEAAARYKAPPITLTDEAKQLLTAYRWPGNVRQLRNLTEQISVIEKEREVDAATLAGYLPKESTALVRTPHADPAANGDAINERELIFKFLFDMKNDLNALKEQVRSLGGGSPRPAMPTGPFQDQLLYSHGPDNMSIRLPHEEDLDVEHTEVEESLSLEDKEKELVRKALDKHRGKRKKAAEELGISERTLYRKIKEWNIE
jgi:DNA-binding NtrC family response regulator